MDKAQKKKDAKERKKEEKDRKKEEMNYYRSSLNELLKDERRSQLAFPPTLNTGQRKKLHTYAHSIGLKSKSTGKGKFMHSKSDSIQSISITNDEHAK